MLSNASLVKNAWWDVIKTFGKEISLGYTYIIGGIKLDEPYLEVPEDFEEIDEPKRPQIGGVK